jgi:hypothetical protein
VADIVIKQGATLGLTAQWANEDGTIPNLTGATLLSQVRDIDGNWICDLPWVLNGAAASAAVTYAATGVWPQGQLRCDLRVTDASGNVTFSETFGIRVRAAISTGSPA